MLDAAVRPTSDMRRLIALLASVTVVLVVAATPVAADPGAPSSGPSSSSSPASNSSASNPPASNPSVSAQSTAAAVPADAVGVTPALVAGSGLAVTLDPGTSEEHDVVVSNHTANLRLTVKLEATDATGALGTGAAAWLTFGDDAIQLDPHAATTVPTTIAVPHDTQPGSSLAHIRATVESAVAAADGTPVTGSALSSFPVSIVVSGTPTAQIAIADVHRVDQGSTHQLAVVLRNFGADGAQVSGHVRVAGSVPQTIPFHADLAASRDTTIDLDWKAPPSDAATDLAVDLEYGPGNVASWSSRLGDAAPAIGPVSTTVASVPVTTPSDGASAASGSSSSSPGKPLWKKPLVAILVLVALLGAGMWFAFEIRAARRRRASGPEFVPYGAGLGSAGGASPESLDLAAPDRATHRRRGAARRGASRRSRGRPAAGAGAKPGRGPRGRSRASGRSRNPGGHAGDARSAGRTGTAGSRHG